MSSSSDGPRHLDAEQLAFDLEDALARLQIMRRAIQARDDARDAVRALSAQLRTAKRKLKEAEWQLATALSSNRSTGPSPQKESK